MNDKVEGTIWVFVTALMVLVSIIGFSEAVTGWDIYGVILSLVLGIILTLASLVLWKLRKSGQEKKVGLAVEDERTQRIVGRAANSALLVGGFFMLALLWYDWFQGHGIIDSPELSTAWALILSILANSGLFLLLRWYYGRKDVG